MNEKQRAYFDEQLERVLAELPPPVLELLDEIPLIVDDYPAPDVLRRTGTRRRGDLCGLYTGVPLTERSVEHSGRPSDVIHLFRGGILAATIDQVGCLTDHELRRQIRLTILHEFGHYYGLSEDELEELGY
jgi:predicted Zn-dependent protease with MMP-like domain